MPQDGRALRDRHRASRRSTAENGRVDGGADRTAGTVECRYVINAAGAHAYHVARLVGLELPIVPVRHEYFVTVPLAGLHAGSALLPRPGADALRPGRRRRPAAGRLGSRPRCTPIRAATPLDGSRRRSRRTGPVLNDFEARFARLFPAGGGAEKAASARAGPRSRRTGDFILGESRRVPGFVMAGGCNAHGISGSAGIGRLLVESLLDPNPSATCSSLSPDRFTEQRWNWDRRAGRPRGCMRPTTEWAC